MGNEALSRKSEAEGLDTRMADPGSQVSHHWSGGYRQARGEAEMIHGEVD